MDDDDEEDYTQYGDNIFPFIKPSNDNDDEEWTWSTERQLIEMMINYLIMNTSLEEVEITGVGLDSDTRTVSSETAERTAYIMDQAATKIVIAQYTGE